jgi:hypothetical protein
MEMLSDQAFPTSIMPVAGHRRSRAPGENWRSLGQLGSTLAAPTWWMASQFMKLSILSNLEVGLNELMREADHSCRMNRMTT